MHRPALRISAQALALGGLLAVVLGLPIAGAIRDVALVLAAGENSAMQPVGPIHDGWVIARTAGYPLAVAVLATVLGWPAAWVLRSGTRRAAMLGPLAVVPVLLPTYLAFAGFRLAFAPGTALGNALADASPDVQVVVWRSLAVIGLALWSAPLAALILAAGLTRVPAGALDSLRVDGAGRVRRCLHIARMTLPAQALCVGVIALLTVGSAVPIHLAQIDTLAQRVWWRLQLSPSGEVWMTAWPVVALAAVAGWAMSRVLVKPGPDSDPAPAPVSRLAWALTAAIWGLGVVLPIVLFALSLRTHSALGRFWTDLAPALRGSASVAVAVGLILGVIAALTWLCAARSPRSRLIRLALGGSIALAIIPGVLIGQAMVSVWSLPGLSALADFADRFGGRVVLAHCARFAVVAVLVGLYLARTEPPDLRDARAIDGATGPRGWWRAAGRARWAAVAGVAVAGFALSLHEIEASVIVSPPGMGSLPQRLLELLHYNRDEQLAAAALNLVGCGIILAVLAGSLLGSLRRA